MAQNTSSIIRTVAIAGTLLIVGLIGIGLVFEAGGLSPSWRGLTPSGVWPATWSLARMLLPLVLVSYFFLFRRGQQSPLLAWSRSACWAVAFVLGLFLAATLDTNLPLDSTENSIFSAIFRRLAEPLVGICLAVLVFSPKSLRDLVLKELAPVEPRPEDSSPEDPAPEDRILSLYFGFLSGLLLYLVFMEIWSSSS